MEKYKWQYLIKDRKWVDVPDVYLYADGTKVMDIIENNHQIRKQHIDYPDFNTNDWAGFDKNGFLD